MSAPTRAIYANPLTINYMVGWVGVNTSLSTIYPILPCRTMKFTLSEAEGFRRSFFIPRLEPPEKQLQMYTIKKGETNP